MEVFVAESDLQLVIYHELHVSSYNDDFGTKFSPELVTIQ